VRIARLVCGAAALGLLSVPLVAVENPQLLTEFRKTRIDVSEVHVIAERPLLVAVTGHQGWAAGELLGVFGRRGEQIVPISVLPNSEFPGAVRVERQTPDSITLGLADSDSAAVSDNLKIFFDPRSYFPRRIVHYAPVSVRRIALVSGVTTLTGSDGKQDFTARERNGVWQISTAPAVPLPPPQPLESELQIQPDKAKQFPQIAEENIGPYQKVGTKIWIGKTFRESAESVGVGDIGYFDTVTQDWVFLHLREMADWSASALLVEPTAIWVGLVRGNDVPGGLLRYDRTTRKVTTIPLADQIDRMVRVGRRLFCGTSGGFAVVDQNQVHRFEFTPQLDGSYQVTLVP
jgi:hypothetical protein